MNPYVERKYFYLSPQVVVDGTGPCLIVPHKADYLTIIERIIVDTNLDVTLLGIGINIILLIGSPFPPPWAGAMIQRYAWQRWMMTGNHTNDELNIPLEGGKSYGIYIENDTGVDQTMSLLVTVRYEKRPAEGKSHG